MIWNSNFISASLPLLFTNASSTIEKIWYTNVLTQVTHVTNSSSLYLNPKPIKEKNPNQVSVQT